jgi:hypothetical protein
MAINELLPQALAMAMGKNGAKWSKGQVQGWILTGNKQTTVAATAAPQS